MGWSSSPMSRGRPCRWRNDWSVYTNHYTPSTMYHRSSWIWRPIWVLHVGFGAYPTPRSHHRMLHSNHPLGPIRCGYESIATSPSRTLEYRWCHSNDSPRCHEYPYQHSWYPSLQCNSHNPNGTSNWRSSSTTTKVDHSRSSSTSTDPAMRRYQPPHQSNQLVPQWCSLHI